MPKLREVDKIFMWITVMLVAGGFFIFVSASMGLLAQERVAFSRVVFNQIFFGLIGGGIAAALFSRIKYTFWQKYAFYIFIAAIVITLLVFIPGLGFSHGGARRWLSVGSLSVQPAEFLKLGFVIYFAAWISGVKRHITSFKWGILPLTILLAIIGAILLLQPDTGTLAVIALAGIVMFVAAGGGWRHTFALIGIGLVLLGTLAAFKPYIRNRLLTFFDPSSNPLGSGYQIQQSLIAVGSGELFGRGFGQSIQKFNYLPEPIGDSIFAVFAEEWGFVGSMLLILGFLAFALRGFRIAARAPNTFSRLLVVGIITLIVGQSFINIASMLGIAPLTGMPLIFVSQGGTALLISLASVGIVLNVSRYQRTR